MDQVLPTHKPHEQLRTEAPSQKDHTDKYVSCFVSGENNVDMSFTNPILSKSSDHFKVGIDELTCNLNNLSLLEYVEGEVFFRILRRGYRRIADNLFPEVQNGPSISGGNLYQLRDGPVGTLDQYRDSVEFKIDRPYLTMMEVIERCKEIATSIDTFIRLGLVNVPANGGNPAINLYMGPIAAAAAANQTFLQIALTPNGQLKFSGNKTFWANFTIQVPVEKYRQILFKNPDKEFISLHPVTGAIIDVPYISGGGNGPNYDFTPAEMNPVYDGGHLPLPGYGVQYAASGNMLNMLDRRVTLEVGCSLPIKNSPLIDHNEETPDYVLGRYMFHQPYTLVGAGIGGTPDLHIPGLGTRQMQGPRDRVCYHHLQPQQRIQNVRIRLWARVRTYDTSTKKWGMKTVECPVEDGDYWHLKLHFVEKGRSSY